MQVKTASSPPVSYRPMDWFSRMIALCDSALAAAGGAPASLPLALFAAGLAGGALHCAGMCGPFVLGQAMATAEDRRDRDYGEWRRLAGAALLPYHLGRTTTYTILGAAAGGATAVFASTTGFAWLSALLLAAAAALLLAQACGLAFGGSAAWSGTLTAMAGPLSRSQGAAGRYGLGVLLGLLPCGLLYGALAAAAGSASAMAGALAMLAFALGTMPALIAVGWGGLLLRRRLRETARWIAAPVLVANAMMMLALASQRV